MNITEQNKNSLNACFKDNLAKNGEEKLEISLAPGEIAPFEEEEVHLVLTSEEENELPTSMKEEKLSETVDNMRYKSY